MKKFLDESEGMAGDKKLSRKKKLIGDGFGINSNDEFYFGYSWNNENGIDSMGIFKMINLE